MKSVANDLIFESPYQAFPMNNAKMFFHAMHYLRTYHARWRLGYYASAILLVLNPFFSSAISTCFRPNAICNAVV